MIRAALLASFLAISPAQAGDLAGTMLSKIGQGMPKGCPPRLWCNCAINKALKANGFKSTGSNRAMDTRRYGLPASGYARNNIIVFRHHSGVATGNTKACPRGKVHIVSGNHSNRYGVGCYSKSRVIAIRKAVR